MIHRESTANIYYREWLRLSDRYFYAENTICTCISDEKTKTINTNNRYDRYQWSGKTLIVLPGTMLLSVPIKFAKEKMCVKIDFIDWTWSHKSKINLKHMNILKMCIKHSEWTEVKVHWQFKEVYRQFGGLIIIMTGWVIVYTYA